MGSGHGFLVDVRNFLIYDFVRDFIPEIDMSKQQPTVCIIGAGLSGLASIKCMLDAHLDVTCFEKDVDIAGRWNPHSQVFYLNSI